MENEDKPKQDDNCEAANAASPRPTRREFLKGLTTGTVAIGALSQAGCAPAIPPLKTRGATNTTTVCPVLRSRLRPGRLDARRQGDQHRGRPGASH